MKKEKGKEATKIHTDIILQIFWEPLVSLGAAVEVAPNAEKQLVCQVAEMERQPMTLAVSVANQMLQRQFLVVFVWFWF